MKQNSPSSDINHIPRLRPDILFNLLIYQVRDENQI